MKRQVRPARGRRDSEVRLVSMREAFLKAYDVQTPREVRMIFGRRRFNDGTTNVRHSTTRTSNTNGRRVQVPFVQQYERRVA